MPDLKKEWPDLVYKLIMAILAVIFGYNQYQDKQIHSDLAAYVSQFQELKAHTDYIDPYGE